MRSSQNPSAKTPITPLVMIIGALLISLSFAAGYVIGQQNPTLDALTKISSEINAEVASTSKSSGDDSTQIKPQDQSSLIPLPPNHPMTSSCHRSPMSTPRPHAHPRAEKS